MIPLPFNECRAHKRAHHKSIVFLGYHAMLHQCGSLEMRYTSMHFYRSTHGAFN